MVDINSPIYRDKNKARKHLEALRWADGRFCPHCGETENTSVVRGKKHRPGLYYCNSCKGQFTVTIGTVFERSKVPLNKWLLAFHLMASSKKGISAHQLHRTLGVTYKTAWFMAHRIRESMRDDSPTPMGGGGKIVESDETYLKGGRTITIETLSDGRKVPVLDRRHYKIMALVERGGRSRAFHLDSITSNNVRNVLVSNVDRDTHLMTDEAGHYRYVGWEYKTHQRVNHSKKEYARGNVSTNTIEGYFSIFKRGMKGTYQHCKAHHLQRYLAEFDFRYSNRDLNDFDRATLALKGIEGKRLTFRRTG
ncbi:MAG: IS1595 family transposase, partial [Rhodospirillales bacterium]|nr:IS1595 family transposase [Rhodospirillales bacterium]